MAAISEISFATIGVRDLEATARFYREAFGYESSGSSPVTPEQAALWSVPPGMRAQQCVLGRAGAKRGRLRLLACATPGEHCWDAYERYFDYGHYALNIRVPDIQALYPKLVAAGARPKSKPTHWVVEPGLEAWDSMCWDPDGTLIDSYTVTGRPDVFADLQGRASELETVALHVSDAARARRFYEAIGYSLFYDRRIDDLGEFFHLPKDVVLHNVNMYKPEQSTIGRVEIVQYVGLPGRPVGVKARPPNLGILSISFEAGDLEDVARRVREGGGRVTSAPVRVTLPAVGPAEVLTAVGPDEEALEFYRPLPAR